MRSTLFVSIVRDDLDTGAYRAYRELADGLSEMIEDGRLKLADIPNDYGWLVETLAKIAGLDPGVPTNRKEALEGV
jgi:hypothetical protein